MKTILLLFFVSLITYQDVQKQAETAVVKHIKNTANDINGFQIVFFGRAEKFILPFSKTNVGQLYLRLAEVPLAEAKEMDQKIKSGDVLDSKFNRDLVIESLTRARKYMNEFDSANATYKPVQYGWKIYSKYRLKDDAGLIKLREDTFYMNKNFKVVDTDTILVYIR